MPRHSHNKMEDKVLCPHIIHCNDIYSMVNMIYNCHMKRKHQQDNYDDIRLCLNYQDRRI